MFRGGFGLSTEALRRREAQAAARPPSKRSGEEEDDSEDEKTAQAKALISSSAEKDRKPDVFDTHVGPFLESYVLWCQKKGVILGWIPGLVGVALFILVALAVGFGAGHVTGQAIIWVLDQFGLVVKLKAFLFQLDHM